MIGAKIRELRLKKRMTLSELARTTEFTASYISQLERDIIQPSLSALKKISVVLEVPIYAFLAFEENQTIVTKANERKKLELPDSNIVYEFVSPMAANKVAMPKMEIIYFKLDPKSWTNKEPVVHLADESAFVLKGKLEAYVDDEQFMIEEGDNIYIRENSRHRYYNPTDEIVEGLVTMSPAIY
ncbi:MAG: helix-turn-helix transcriptional regulator [Clostridiales bacterium]|nr:helix-turn-helix transcriptional regulator [Clostridiales bacterium]